MYRALLKLHHLLEPSKALSTHSFYIISKNLKDTTMGNQQETKFLCRIYYPPFIFFYL